MPISAEPRPVRSSTWTFFMSLSVLALLGILATGGLLSVNLFLAMGDGGKGELPQEDENLHVGREVLRVQREINRLGEATNSDFEMRRFVRNIQSGRVITAYAEATGDFHDRVSIQQFTRILGPDFLNGRSASFDGVQPIPDTDPNSQSYLFTAQTIRNQPITFKLTLVRQDFDEHLPRWQIDQFDLHPGTVAETRTASTLRE